MRLENYWVGFGGQLANEQEKYGSMIFGAFVVRNLM